MKTFKILFSFLLLILLHSCKSKPVITDNDLTINKKKEYIYSGKIDSKETKYFARKLDVKKEEITDEKLYSFIKSWEHTTYLFGGVDKNGIDCSSITQRLYSYVYDITLSRTSLEMYHDKRFKNVKNPKEGDLVFFKIDEEKEVSHVGVYLKNDYFFSSSVVDGCNISSLKKKYWQKYYIGAKRIKT